MSHRERIVWMSLTGREGAHDLTGREGAHEGSEGQESTREKGVNSGRGFGSVLFIQDFHDIVRRDDEGGKTVGTNLLEKS